MKFGLSDSIIESIKRVLEANPKVDKAFVFGSRAKGNYRPGSDIDIAVKGYNLTLRDVLQTSGALDDTNIAYKIDLLNYDSIKEPALTEHIDRVGVEFYSRWKEYNLADLCLEVKSGGTPLTSITEYYKNGTIPWLKTKEVLNNKISTTENYITESGLKNSSAKLIPANSIIIAMYGDGDTAGRVAMNRIPLSTNQACCNLVINNSVASSEFVFYFLRKSYDELVGLKTGSGQQNLSSKLIKEFKIGIPPLSEQTAIASTLTSLDDKIDLLHRQNKTLEELAEVLFRQWFVEEAEEGWEVAPLGEIFDIGIGRTPPRKEQHWFSTIADGNIKWVSIKDLGTSGLYIDTVSEYLTQEAVEKFSVPIIPANTVMLSFKMTIGRLAISAREMVSNEAIAHFKQKKGSHLFPEFLYLFLRTYSWQELGSTSSIVESINSQIIKEIRMIIPEENKLHDFKEMIKPFFDKIKVNQVQIRTLTQQRDNLLPKLMSGEVRVKMS